MPQEARLRVHGHGNVEVELVTGYLTDFKHAYDFVLLFEATIDAMNCTVRDFRVFPFPRYLFASEFLPSRRLGGRFTDRRHQRKLHLLFLERNNSFYAAVSFNSPGFWEFLGTLNAFEVLRKFLNDRHERQKDHEYRELAEQRRLELENLLLENKVLSARVRLAKEMGATDRDLAPLINELLNRPLVALGRYQDKGVIENTELVSDFDHAGGQAE